MDRQLSASVLRQENLIFAGTKGVSRNNRKLHFVPAFRDDSTGRIEVSRFENGQPAPIHMLVGLPRSWAASFSSQGKICSLKPSISAGFVRDNEFYTRAEAANVV